MRLEILNSGHGWKQKLKMFVMGMIGGIRVPDVVRTLSYRPEFFGKPFSALADSALMDSDAWTHGECELFAAFVSSRNQCPF